MDSLPFGFGAMMQGRKNFRILPNVQNSPGHPPPFPDLLARDWDTNWGSRPDGTEKGPGFLGVLGRPDGGISTEISASFGPDVADGQDIPLLVPTLTREEVDALLSNNNEGEAFFSALPTSVIDKAIAFAQQRQAQGLPYFARPTEYVEQRQK